MSKILKSLFNIANPIEKLIENINRLIKDIKDGKNCAKAELELTKAGKKLKELCKNGIWILLGKNENGEIVCLQVAVYNQNDGCITEFMKDFQHLLNSLSQNPGEYQEWIKIEEFGSKVYVNKKLGSYLHPDIYENYCKKEKGEAITALLRRMADFKFNYYVMLKEYSDLRFLQLNKDIINAIVEELNTQFDFDEEQNDFDEEQNDFEKIEKIIACVSEAIYWESQNADIGKYKFDKKEKVWKNSNNMIIEKEDIISLLEKTLLNNSDLQNINSKLL